jgi:predicted DNA-binding protein
MANLYGNSYEKVTFNMPIELKEKVLALKKELNIPLSSIYNEAISNYIKQQELKKWENGVNLALKDSDYLKSIKDNGLDSGDIYEY